MPEPGQQEDVGGQLVSPGGFVFGVVGWTWGEARPRSVTWFLDGTAKVSDQHGRPIRGFIVTVGDPVFASCKPAEGGGKQVLLAMTPPTYDDPPDARRAMATHLQVVKALEAERVDWQRLSWAGWPQLPYAMLRGVAKLPPTPVEELRKIKDPALRKDALRMRRELDEQTAQEARAIEEE